MSMKAADRWFSLYIRQRDGYCRACGTADNLQCAHIISRSYKAIRCDERNAVALCRSCHVYYTHRPIEWEQQVTDWFGDEYLDDLRDKALTYERQNWKQQNAHWREKAK